jgi:VWFA-related protein
LIRKCAILLFLWGIAWPAMADKTMSIDQMEQFLIKLHGKPDGKVAGELEDQQLTERVSPARLARWEADFPGKRTQEELMKLADMTAFLNPPASDVLRDPPPDMETQQRMVSMALEYVRTTMVRLPDFYATRETMHFEDALMRREQYAYAGSTAMDAHASLTDLPKQTPGMGTTTEYRGLHSTGGYTTTVTYRDGQEVFDEDAGKRKKAEAPALGLTTSGEFGPILGAVINDVIHTGVIWLRWEQGDEEPAAVFHYVVAANQSHFRVGITVGGRQQALFPAYHGEIEIDPATGEILRLSEVADAAPPYAAMQAAIVVYYAQVKIGNQSYICPVRGVAFSEIPVPNGAANDQASEPVQVNLNDVAFTHYHEFSSEAHIVPAGSANGEGNAEEDGTTAAPEAAANVAPEPAGASGAATGSPAPPAETSPAPVASAASAPAAEAAAAPAPAAEPAAVPASPGTTSGATGAIATGTVLHTRSRLVLLDVTVTEHDKPVKGLDRGRFHIFEDGHEQPISSFEESEPPASVDIATPPALPPNTYTNVPVYPETSAVNVLLLDALNTPMGDQEQVRKQMIAYLSTIKPGTALAIFTLSSKLRMVVGFSTDVTRLKQALESRKPSARSSADVGANASESLSSSITQAGSSIATSSDPGTLWMMGQIRQFAADTNTYETDQRVTMTLDALSDLARYLTGIPGKKNLIWFSGSFPIGLNPDAMLSTQLKDVRDYSIDMQRTSALLSTARISVYPVDARGLMTAPTTDASYTPAMATLQGVRPAVSSDNSNFSTQMSLDQGSMSTIAAETGGRVYSSGNDLKAAVEKIVANDSSYYALSYVPPEGAGGKHGADFRKVEVKIDGGKYQLAYRQGYYSDDANKLADDTGLLPGPMAAAMMLGAPPSTQILFQTRALPVGDPELKGPVPDSGTAGDHAANLKGGAHRYIMDLSVNPEGLTFTEGANGTRDVGLECALVAYDGDGNSVNSLGRKFELHLSPEQYEQVVNSGRTIPVRLAMDLPAGDSVLRVVIYEPSSARIGSLEIPMKVADK